MKIIHHTSTRSSTTVSINFLPLVCAKLAVDETCERQGFGRFLVLAAIGLALSVSGIINCRYLTVNSRPESMSFYERPRFKVVEKYRQTDFPEMYIDMQPVVKRMQPEESLEDFVG